MPDREWHNDAAHTALIAWLQAWRKDHPEPRTGVQFLPPGRFTAHIGREAVSLMREGIGKVELARLFAAAGYDDECPGCGRKVAEIAADPEAANLPKLYTATPAG